MAFTQWFDTMMSGGEIKKFITKLNKLKTRLKSFKYYKYLLLIIPIVLILFLISYFSQPWLFRIPFVPAKTYAKATVLGINVGNLNAGQLDNKLTQQKTKFDTQKITFVNAKDQWTFDPSKLGMTLDIQSTSQAVWKLNNLSFMDKLQLLTNKKSPVVPPIPQLDEKVCVTALSAISILQVEPQDALFYLDQGIKIKPDEAGTRFSAPLTCEGLSKQLASNLPSVNIKLEPVPANITAGDLNPQLQAVQSMVGKPLTLKSGGYQLDLTPEQLLAMLAITKTNSGAQISWSQTKLDELVNNISTKVNTYDKDPVLGACQYLISGGGNWLNKNATKQIFQNLLTNNSRSYNLQVDYYKPNVATRKPVTPGNRGTVYLTFDDGLLYGNQIMNYAACYQVKVTFFEIGSRVGVDAAGLKRAINEGHAVQSHGYEHAAYDYGTRTYDWQLQDISHSISAIMGVTGVRPTYFRPPGGNRSANTYTAAAANGVKLILWGASSTDTAGIGSSTICSRVLAAVFPGASVLMHSSKQTTAGAVPCIIEGLAARGYSMQALR